MAEVLHTAIWVSDLDRAREFYESTLGLEYSRHVEGEGTMDYFVVGPNSETELQLKSSEKQSGPSEPKGIDHVAIGVKDVDETIERISKRWASEVQEGPETLRAHGVRYAMVTDPDGYTVELIAEID